MKFILLALLLSLHTLNVRADIRLPSLIQTNMVVQQDTLVTLWGWSDPGETVKVKVSWARGVITATQTGNGQWLATVRTPPADGKSHTLTFKGKNTIEIRTEMSSLSSTKFSATGQRCSYRSMRTTASIFARWTNNSVDHSDEGGRE